MDDLTVHRGANHVTGADICTIVMSYRAQETTREAVISLLEQDTASEIVVVNSGGPSLAPVLGSLLERVQLIETQDRLLPGGARNAGVRHSTAPIVSFLAADCMAAPGWISQRLAAHRSGHAAVASALRPASRDGVVSPAALATYWARHWRRMPETPAAAAGLHGASYVRPLFERFGMFRDDLLVSEDSLFNTRLQNTGVSMLWHPGVVTHHRYPQDTLSALLEELQRGAQTGAYHRGEMKKGIGEMASRGLEIRSKVMPSLQQWLGIEHLRAHTAALRLVPHLQRARLLGAAYGVMMPAGRPVAGHGLLAREAPGH